VDRRGRQPLSDVALAGVRTQMSQEPRPRAPRYKRQGQLRCRLVRFGFGRCWGLFGDGKLNPILGRVRGVKYGKFVSRSQANLVEAPPGEVYRGSTGKSGNRRAAGGTGT
jgi:hypothetical protein